MKSIWLKNNSVYFSKTHNKDYVIYALSSNNIGVGKMDLKGKVVVVTGAGNGIGRELVLSLLSKGAIVVGLDRNEEALLETKQISNIADDRFRVFVVDLTDRVAVFDLPEKILAVFGQIDGIINNAGIIQTFMPVEKFTIEQVHRIIDVNFYGTVHMIQAFLPYLKKQSKSIIVNVSSMGGFLPVKFQTIYGASKAAVKLLTEGIKEELRNTSVHVMLVIPGGVSTEIMSTAGIDTKKLMSSKLAKTYRMLTPQKVSKSIIRAIKRSRNRIILGIDAKIMDFLYRISPRLATRIISKMLDVDRYL